MSRRRPFRAGFRGLCYAALAWEVIGCFMYLGQVTADRASLPLDQRAMWDATPTWMVAAYAIAVWVGLAGAILLLMRRRLALPLLLVSLIAVVIQFSGLFLVPQLRQTVPEAALAAPAAIFVVSYAIFMLRAAGGQARVAALARQQGRPANEAPAFASAQRGLRFFDFLLVALAGSAAAGASASAGATGASTGAAAAAGAAAPVVAPVADSTGAAAVAGGVGSVVAVTGSDRCRGQCGVGRCWRYRRIDGRRRRRADRRGRTGRLRQRRGGAKCQRGSESARWRMVMQASFRQ